MSNTNKEMNNCPGPPAPGFGRRRRPLEETINAEPVDGATESRPPRPWVTEKEEVTERRRNRASEKMRDRETKETEDMEEISPLATRVRTLKEAVQLSLESEHLSDPVFTFARAIRAFEITCDRRLPEAELNAAFNLWWTAARSSLPDSTDYDECRLLFRDAYARARIPLGSNPLEEAIKLADSTEPPPEAMVYSNPKLRRLVSVCHYLQKSQGEAPFFLSVRDAARIMGITNLHHANAMLTGLIRDKVLTEVAKGTKQRARRFRFNLISPPTG